MFIHHKTKMWDFCTRKEAESIWAFQLTSNNQCKNKKCTLWDSERKHITFLLTGEDLHISKKTSSNFLFLIPYNIWEVLVKIFLMFPDASTAKKINMQYVFVVQPFAFICPGRGMSMISLKNSQFSCCSLKRQHFSISPFMCKGNVRR